MNTLLAAVVNGFVVSVPLAVAVWVVLRVSRRGVNATTRYAIWWVLLALVVCLPFRYIPRRSVPHYERIAPARAPMHVPVIVERPSVSSRPLRADPPPRFPLRVSPGPWSVLTMALWALAGLAMLLRLIVSYALLGRMKQKAVDAPEVVAASARLALERLGVTRRVRVALVNDAVSPMVAGPFNPTILLPAAMLSSMRDAEIEQICLHEAAHLARRDDWVLMAQRLLEALFAPHPLMRWIAGQINLEREIACDDLVISVTGSARPYAACLTRIAELAGGLSGSPAAAAVNDERSHLTRRVEMLLDKSRHAGARLLGARLAILACGLALVTFLASRKAGVVAFAAQPRAAAFPVIPLQSIAGSRPAPRPQAPAPKPVAAEPIAPAPAREVRVAVSVTDPMNRFVTGLEAAAFHVFENGVERKIVDFTQQASPISIVVVWDENSELRDLRDSLAKMQSVYTEQYPDVRRIEATIADIEQRANDRESGRILAGIQSVMDAAPGSRVSLVRVSENQSVLDGIKSAAEQLRGSPPEQSAIVLVFDPGEWSAGRVVFNATGIPIYALGIAIPGDGHTSSASGGALPVLISDTASWGPYPIVAQKQIPGSLGALAAQLVSRYVIGYLPLAPDTQEGFHTLEVMLTEPAGLPHLTAHVSTGAVVPAR